MTDPRNFAGRPPPYDASPGEDVKAFGAGVLSSFGEMEWACSPSPSQEPGPGETPGEPPLGTARLLCAGTAQRLALSGR